MNLVPLASLVTITYTLSNNDFHFPAKNIIYTLSFGKERKRALLLFQAFYNNTSTCPSRMRRVKMRANTLQSSADVRLAAQSPCAEIMSHRCESWIETLERLVVSRLPGCSAAKETTESQKSRGTWGRPTGYHQRSAPS